jgi:hypothetical protein
VLLTSIVAKFKANEHFQKRVNISTFEDCSEDISIDEEEDVLVFNEDQEPALLSFLKRLISSQVATDLVLPQEDSQKDDFETTFGVTKQPFGIVRSRAVELLAQCYQVFDLHSAFAESDLYNALLFFMEYHPFHNVLHAKTAEIFLSALERKEEPVITHLL